MTRDSCLVVRDITIHDSRDDRREVIMAGEEAAAILTIYAINKLIELAVDEYNATGKIPTYEELEAKNFLTDLKIQKLMAE
jgi:hypothetical protein